ncbi:DUF2312 domain-containing protein [Rhizobium ruizarguesonis]|nr:DUF2312 domain-containing protein [Rhizobium ruizarguesonis]
MTADKQLKAYIDRVLRLKEEQDTIGDDIREIYAEAKAAGYDKTIMGKLVAHLRRELKQGAGAVAEAESIFDTYLNAYQRASGTPVATHTHEEEFDPITGEFLDQPVNAKLVATVATGMQTEIGRKALIAAVDIMIAREEAEEEFHTNPEEEAEAKGAATVDAEDRAEGDADRQRSPKAGTTDGGRQGVREQVASSPVPASNSETHQRPSTNDEPSQEVGPQAEASPAGTGAGTLADREGRHEGEAAPVDLPTNQPETATKQRVNGHSQHEGANAQATVRNEVVTVVGTERGTVSNSEIDPTEDRKEDHSLDGNADASVGGRHVTAQANRAATAGALVQVAPATKPLRPHCRNPGEHCGGYGSTHCGSCLRAAREPELEACT